MGDCPSLVVQVSNLALLVLPETVGPFHPQINASLVIPHGLNAHGSQLLVQQTEKLIDDPSALISVAEFLCISTRF